MSDGVIGLGAGLYLTNGSAVLTKVEGLQSVGRPNLTVSKEDTTDFDSVDGIQEFIGGLADPGEFKFSGKYEAGSPTDDLLNEHLISREVRPFRIVLPNSSGSEDVTGNILLLTYSPNDLEPGKVQTFSATAAVSGPTAQAASA
jgi:hypothetical protein